jgi:two-component system, OmpR family, sensor histidine kinase KdpD
MLAALAAATLAIAALAVVFHVAYPAPVYLLAVIAVGIGFGTTPAVLASVASFLLYDFLFVPPVFTFTIASPDEWLNLLVLLAVAVIIGRLAGLQADRTREAAERAREAEALYAVTGVLAATRTVAEATPAVLSKLARLTAMDRVWFGLGPSPAEERIVADTAAGRPLPVAVWSVVLQRAPDGDHHWVRTHVALRNQTGTSPGATVYRVRIESAGEALGSIWSLRALVARSPDRSETRILAAAADQLGQAVIRDRLAADATNAEIVQRSDALKSALLDSVSHDLRTPLATIRAAAGSMLDPDVRWSAEEQRTAFEAIDAEADRMGRLVRNLLDLSRIEGGVLKPDLAPHDTGELVRQVARRVGAANSREIAVDVPDGLPPGLVDDVYFTQVVANLIENAVRHGGSHVSVRAREVRPQVLEIVVEDDGPGVPPAAVPHLFEKFYQVPRPGRGSRHGMGIGLTVVAGLTRAMGGAVDAGHSQLGGLAITVTVPAALALPDEVEGLAQVAPGEGRG